MVRERARSAQGRRARCTRERRLHVSPRRCDAQAARHCRVRALVCWLLHHIDLSLVVCASHAVELRLARLLLEYGANVDAVNMNGAAAVHIATALNDLETVSVLLNYAYV